MAQHFFIVGAQRTGTTYLYRLLDRHPDIEMAKPLRPEPKYFLNPEYASLGVDAYIQKHFDPKTDPNCRGEKSTTYSERSDAAQRIASMFPRARIIMVLRDPVDRAISNYRFSCQNGFESLPMWEAFQQEADRIDAYDQAKVSASPFAYLKRGMYIEAVRRYEEFFPADRILLLMHEKLVSNDAAIRPVYAFLGVDDSFVPDINREPVNASETDSPSLTGDQRGWLYDYFAESNAALADRTGLDLSCWAPARANE